MQQRLLSCASYHWSFINAKAHSELLKQKYFSRGVTEDQQMLNKTKSGSLPFIRTQKIPSRNDG